MSPSESLKEFLKKKKERDDAVEPPSEREREKEIRRAAIEQLYGDVERWLKTSIDDGTVALEKDAYWFEDARLGGMTVTSMELSVGRSIVRFCPVGSRIAGASARVDMMSGDRTIPIIELPNRGWHFLIRQPVTTPIAVTEESFADAFRNILEE